MVTFPKYQGKGGIVLGTTLKLTGFLIAALLNPIKLPTKTNGTYTLNHNANIINSTGNLT